MTLSAIFVILLCASPTAPQATHESGNETASTPPAALESKRQVVVFPLHVDGELREHQRETLERQLLVGLSAETIFDVNFERVTAHEVTRCSSAACRTSIAESVGADFLVDVSVRVRERDYTVRAILVDGSTGVTIADGEETCEMCGLSEVAEVVAAQAAALAGAVRNQALGAQRLVVHSIPQGARVEVDGEVLGHTPLEFELEPGAHHIKVSHPERQADDRNVTAVVGVRGRLDVTLLPKVALATPKQERSNARYVRRRTLGVVGLVAGSASLAAGATLLALHGRPLRGICSGTNIDEDGDCRFQRKSLAGGVVFASLGAAALATGIALLATTKKRSGRTASMLVAPRNKGLMAGVRLRW